MTERDRVFAGVGGIGFTLLFAAGAMVASTPGGSYSEKDMADYVAKGHQTSILIASVLALLGVLGLLLLVTGLRERVGPGSFLSDVYAGTSLVAVAGFAIGWLAWLAVPLAKTIGGSAVVVDPRIGYVILQVGGVVVFGVGGIFLGVTLIALFLGSRGALAGWLRWLTLVVGVLGLASMAWLPFFPLLLWGLVAGIWLVSAGRSGPTEPQAAA
jgi:hypothetical protein